ncbi:MAG: oxygen-independent coproporphyrinogen III oxidase [Nitrospiraceae bacterium]|nr:oxygen-independent coproporphyrinogen III oxidase [Nitrospiraceae bacterium]
MTPNMMADVKVSQELLKKYDVAGPRYTSYPTAPVWSTDFTAEDYKDAIRRGQSKKIDKPLSLYFHLPFCDSLCYFCGCSVIISRDRGKTADYIDLLASEMALVGPLYSKKRKVVQLHFGGGSPSNLTPPQNRLLFSHINKWFDVDYSQGEISVEIDPRHASNEYLASIRELGVNRISMGVQDFDPKVQLAVNRIQSVELTEGVFNECRKLGFNGINIDLIYGLPFQTVEGFARTLDQVIRMSPDRIAIFNYAHVPWLKKHMVLIKEQDLPSPEVKFALMSMILDRLTGAGYVVIGMDHFAKPDDELTRAQKEYSLYRNFQGYTTKAEADLVGMGVTAISMVGDVYSQNLKSLPEYQKAVMAGEIPVHRGYRLSQDDEMRRQVITRIMCDLEINRKNVLDPFGKDFDQYFKKEIGDLERFRQDGLLNITPEKIVLTTTGRIFMRNIAMTFDRYLNVVAKGPLFSRTL